MGHHLPVSIAVQGCRFDRLSGHRSDRPRVNRHDNKLGAVAGSDLGNDLRMKHRRRVDRDLVRPGIQKPGRILERRYSPTHSERNINPFRYPGNQTSESLPPFGRRADVQIDELVCPLRGVESTHLHRIADLAQSFEADALDNLSILDIKAWYYSLRQHLT